MTTARYRHLLCLAAACLLTPTAPAQVPSDPAFDWLVPPPSGTGDGKWTGQLGLGLTLASGRSDSTQLSLSGEASRTDEDQRWNLRGLVIRQRAEGRTTADNAQANVRYERDLTRRWFGFGEAAYARDTLQDLSLRQSYSAGFGQRVFDTARSSLNVYAGVAYTVLDRRAGRDDQGAEALLGNDFSIDLSEHATLTQRLVVFPRTVGDGGRRSVFELGLNTRLAGAFGLQLTFLHRYDGDAPAGQGKTDRILFTGITAGF